MRQAASPYWIGLFMLVMSGVVVSAIWAGASVDIASDGLTIKHLQAPEFRFTERSGQPFGSDDLKGRVWIADFIFTYCAGPCPIMSRAMSDLQAGHA